jgi:hypothetical protein
LSKRGVLALEVKGGPVSCKAGVWLLPTRDGTGTKSSEGPLQQAQSGYYSLKNNYLDPLRSAGVHTSVGGWAAVLAANSKHGVKENLPEMPMSLVAFTEDVESGAKLGEFLRRAFDHFSPGNQSRDDHLGGSEIDKILKSLRPSFDRVMPLGVQWTEIRQEQFALTEEQYDKVDFIEDHDRVMVVGGAGTGKTFLALYCAQKELARGQRVLFVARSVPLVTFLRSQAHLKGIRFVAIDEQNSGEELKAGSADTIVVDEGQDLCDLQVLQALGEALTGGLEGGRWRWFGDPNNQLSRSVAFDQTAFDYLRTLCAGAQLARLRRNIRNTPQVVRMIEALTAADVGSIVAKGQGAPVELIGVTLTSDGLSEAAGSLKAWAASNDISPSKIAAIASSRELLDRVEKALRDRGLPTCSLGRDPKCISEERGVILATPDEFKGLERPFAAIFLENSGGAAHLTADIYKAVSRANLTARIYCELDILNELKSRVQKAVEAAASVSNGGNSGVSHGVQLG